MKIGLIKPWSVWSEPIFNNCRSEGLIAKFEWYDGMWREGRSFMVGICDKRMEYLLSIGHAKKL